MRARYLLDTNVISNYSKGHPFVTPKLLSVPVKDVAVSVVTLMEIEFGLLCNPQMSQRTVSRTLNLLREVQVLTKPVTCSRWLVSACIWSGNLSQHNPSVTWIC